ncbi:class I SAM-dependent methyltransferase [Phytohabitans sp. ZYX-F-186]|uniref:Class I SAM-dependent methyltransferase n=1 Tax=Phytohabitans maris TaxID=3071409 RepID=A0ABU0ZKR9_9ACTN|nr:class I SAM-dependent methyltransferase [Phytohabitans sp. ZYX-F-186]
MSYALPNTDRHAPELHTGLATLFDEDTIARLTELGGGGGWAGARCLEFGAGAGSIAGWLADAVGPHGRVYATDLVVEQIPAHPRLTVLRHDLRSDPLPAGVFDLIHGRRVLEHLPQRQIILDRLVDKLAAGGTLLVEGGRALRTPDIVISAPDPDARELYLRYQRTVGQVFAGQGADPGWAPTMHRAFFERGLVDVRTRIRSGYWTGGDAGCRMLTAVQQMLRPKLIEAGMTDADLHAVTALLRDPRLVVRSHEIYATSGQAAA